MKKIILFLIPSVVALLLINYILGAPPGNGHKVYDMIVESGDSPLSIARELKNKQLINSRNYFLFLTRITFSSGKFKQGVFALNDSMSSWEVMNTIVGGKVKLVTFTIPEGYSNRQIGDLLTEKKFVKDRKEFLSITEKKELLEKYNIPAKDLEGYLFPETYSVPLNYPPDKLVEMMVKMFNKKLKKIKNYENNKISPQELHKKIILASIVEREAKKKEEQPLMAGVFLQREKINMNLESCATIQYLFDKPKSRLFEKDLKIVSPYNTYLNKGYPPGPISNPGLPAIQAVFNPIETESLFFVLKPDGSHFFGKTLKEHLNAKKKYIDNLR